MVEIAGKSRAMYRQLANDELAQHPAKRRRHQNILNALADLAIEHPVQAVNKGMSFFQCSPHVAEQQPVRQDGL